MALILPDEALSQLAQRHTWLQSCEQMRTANTTWTGSFSRSKLIAIGNSLRKTSTSTRSQNILDETGTISVVCVSLHIVITTTRRNSLTSSFAFGGFLGFKVPAMAGYYI